MKNLIFLFLLSCTLFANVRDEISQCTNWDDLHAYYTEVNQNSYKVRFLLKYSSNVTKDFINANDYPQWFINAIKKSLKSDDNMLVIEALKCIRMFSLNSLVDDLSEVYGNSSSLHGGASIAVQAELLHTLELFNDENSSEEIRKIYNNTSFDNIGHQNFGQLLRVVETRSNEATKEKTNSFIDEIKKRNVKTRDEKSEDENILENYLKVLEGMK